MLPGRSGDNKEWIHRDPDNPVYVGFTRRVRHRVAAQMHGVNPTIGIGVWMPGPQSGGRSGSDGSPNGGGEMPIPMPGSPIPGSPTFTVGGGISGNAGAAGRFGTPEKFDTAADNGSRHSPDAVSNMVLSLQ
jgi:hypothetical protein